MLDGRWCAVLGMSPVVSVKIRYNVLLWRYSAHCSLFVAICCNMLADLCSLVAPLVQTVIFGSHTGGRGGAHDNNNADAARPENRTIVAMCSV